MESPPALSAGKRPSRKRVTQPPPEGLKVKALGPGAVALSWKPGLGRKPARYLVLRDGRRLVRTRKPAYTDRSVAPGASYRYAVEALDAKGRASRPSKSRRIRVPAGATSLPPARPPTPGGSTNPAPAPGGGTPGPGPEPGPGPSPIGTTLTTPMVDRLFWRAGFGPSDADRQAWTGKDVGELVDFFLSTPNTLRATSTPPLTQGNGAIDPLVSDDELVMDWVDRMARSTNPFVERLTFFWHRHWAVTRDDGVPAKFLLTYADRLRSYADLGVNPGATFRDLAYDMTTKDGAMSLFLSGTQNTKTRPNENYGREFMELFCLGVVDAQGNPNYTQTDVKELARAFTGWRVDQTPTNPTYGQVSFQSGNFDTGSKTILGTTAAFTATQAVDQVLAHPAHAPYLARKLWGEFIATPPDQATVDALAAAYTGSGLQLKPLLRRILTHPLVFESLDEPNLVKPPVLYTVGVLRALDIPMKWFWIPEALGNMQQRPYHPPNVAGWEGGLSWLNTNTVQARFDLLVRALYLKHSTNGSAYPGSIPLPDVPGETAQQAFDRAYGAAGSPWLSASGRQKIFDYAGAAPASTATQRIQRQYALRALILGGPDAQVT